MTTTTPHGGCSARCMGGLFDEESLENHNTLVDALTQFQDDKDPEWLAVALEMIGDGGRTRRGDGVPMPEEFAQFCAAHNWPDPASMAMISRAVVYFAECVEEGAALVARNRRAAGMAA